MATVSAHVCACEECSAAEPETGGGGVGWGGGAHKHVDSRA